MSDPFVTDFLFVAFIVFVGGLPVAGWLIDRAYLKRFYGKK